MGITFLIQDAVVSGINKIYGPGVTASSIQINETKPEFEGDYTVVLFNLTRELKTSPDKLGHQLGTELLTSRPDVFSNFNVIKGFLNLTVSDGYWLNFVDLHFGDGEYGKKPANGKKVMVEYSSPNTNKPLHLGHLRNNFLGWSISEIFRYAGYDVIKTAIANDRGIHICKSMVAWQLFGNGETPESSGVKGDHLVGDYYVRFGNEYNKQVAALVQTGMSKDDAEKKAPIMEAAQNMLLRWEKGDPEVLSLWRTMNEWVYQGFNVTYERIGSDFHKTYYESEVYLLGKQMVEEGLKKGVFLQKEDGSVWIDLTADGLDEKIVQRRDGTAVYITQDIGLVKLKQQEFGADLSIYVVGNEQDYHFKVLRLIARKLHLDGADGIHHLSYGMVELPTGRMKTREGTVVDADELIDEMESISAKLTQELGKVNDFSESELLELYKVLGLGALKFYLLRVDPKKKMVFDPEESIDFHGFTGPFIQYTYARTKSILRRSQPLNTERGDTLLPAEKKVVVELEKFPQIVLESATEMNPAVIAGYVFRLAQTFNSFLTAAKVLSAESAEKKELRLQIAHFTANVIQSSMHLLGIRVPERM